MLRTKTLADIFTIVRILCGAFLFYLAWERDPGTITVASSVLLVAWITDSLDGPLARMDSYRKATWVGEHDLLADLIVSAGVWVYLWSNEYVHPVLGIGYLVLAIFLVWWTNSVHVAWGVQAIPYLMMIITDFYYAKVYAVLLVLFILILVVATWPRFPREKVPEFVHGIRKLFVHKM